MIYLAFDVIEEIERLEPPPRDKSDRLDPPPLFSDRLELLLAFVKVRLESDFFFSDRVPPVVATPDPPPIAAAAAIIRGLDKPRKRPGRPPVSHFPLTSFAGVTSFFETLEVILKLELVCY